MQCLDYRLLIRNFGVYGMKAIQCFGVQILRLTALYLKDQQKKKEDTEFWRVRLRSLIEKPVLREWILLLQECHLPREIRCPACSDVCHVIPEIETQRISK